MEKYKFLSWMRRGIGRGIVEKENFGVLNPNDKLEHADIEFELTVESESSVDKVSNKVSMIGPGDVLGIDEKLIVRVEPAPETFDFEANYLPFIEFFDEDFLWRYTPASPDFNVNNGTRLRPWLALIVLKDTEYTFNPSKKGLDYITIQDSINFDTIFPPKDQHWAWAHVHEDMENDKSTIEKASSDTQLLFSRLLSPRRLERNTNYTAFLIPAFETGRQAGLNAETVGVKAQMSSWDATRDFRIKDFPVYKKWRFGTSNLGDFEYLVKILKPIELPAEDGARKMDLSNVKYGVEEFEGMSIGLEGALVTTDYNAPSWIDSDPNSNKSKFKKQLTEILNLPDKLNSEYSQIDNNASHPFYSEKIVDDPIITPPLYGKWHVMKNKIDSNLYTWFEELNTDPKYRAAAGLGAKVIRDNQERYMEIVWKQVGEINEANRLINESKFAAQVTRAMYSKRLSTMNPDKLVQITGSMHNKVSIENQDFTVMGKLDKSVIPNSIVNSGFRKMLREGNPILNNGLSSSSQITNDVVSKFNIALSPDKTLNQNSLVEQVSPTYEFPESSIDLSPPVPNNFGQLSSYFQNNMNQRAQLFDYQEQITFFNYNHQNNEPLPIGTVEVALKDKVKSCDFISNKLKKKLNINTNDTVWNVKPIMKYPIIKDAMYERLKAINYNYIIPNVAKIPNNSITLLAPNKKFIESFMVGLNHEMSRELLWREFPTDQRGSYFRQFWDKNDAINISEADKVDIKEITDWKKLNLENEILGNNHVTGSATLGIVLVVRGDLLKKFPNTIIYAQKAKIIPKKNTTTNKWYVENVARELDDSSESSYCFPILKAQLEPDITIVGFTITEADMKTKYELDENTGLPKSEKNNPGWFIVFRERPGKIRFGIDDATEAITPATTLNLSKWDDLTWEHLSGNGTVPSVIKLDSGVLGLNISNTNENVAFKANENAATLAKVLLQKPNIVAVHADEMLNN